MAQLPTTRLSPVEEFTHRVIGDDNQANELWRALPAHIRPERFRRNIINLFMQTRDITECDPRVTFREVAKAAALGLLLDPQLGEAYIVLTWNARLKRKEPQLRCGYRGLIKMARQSGEIANIYPGQVCAKDHFVVEEGTDRRLEHRPDYTKPRGEPVCYYAVVAYKDGTKDFDVMSLEEIHAIRDRSDAWKAFVAGKISSTPWGTDEGQMAKKTVLRRLLNRVPQSPDLSEAIALENAADFAPQAPRLAPRLDVVEGSFSQPAIEAPTVEVTEAEDAGPEYVQEPAPLSERIDEGVATELRDMASVVRPAEVRKWLKGLGADRITAIPAHRADEARRTLQVLVDAAERDGA